MAQVTDPQVALAVVNEAKAQGVFAGVPETEPAKLIAQANELVTLAEQAREVGANGGPVMAVIAASEQAPGAAPAAAAPAAPAPPPPTPAPAQVTIYNVKIKDAAGTVYEVTSDIVDQYLAGGYTLVEDAPPPPPPVATPPAPHEPVAAPAPEPETPAAALAADGPTDPSQYAEVEPWKGYKSAKIGDIIAHIENLVRTDGEAAKTTLAHVWEFESNNKERSRLLNKLTEIAQNGVTAEPTPAPAEPEPDDDDDVKAEPPFPDGGPAASPPPTPPAATAPPAPNPAAPPAPPAVPAPTPTPGAGLFDPSDDLIAPINNGSTGRVLAQIGKEGLPIPGVIGDPPAIPEDFTTLSDIEVRKLQGQFNACYARAIYLGSISAGHANDAKVSADAAVDLKIRTTDWPAKTTVKEMEAQAAADENVQQARRVQHEYGEAERQYRHLAQIYLSTFERLSREQTGRESDRAR